MTRLTTDSPQAMLGLSLGAFDLDGDGTDDLIVGAPGSGVGGRLAVVFGPHLDGRFGDFSIEAADLRIDGSLYESCGWGAGLGDFDGDGRADLAVSCPDGGRAGVFYADALIP